MGGCKRARKPTNALCLLLILFWFFCIQVYLNFDLLFIGRSVKTFTVQFFHDLIHLFRSAPMN